MKIIILTLSLVFIGLQALAAQPGVMEFNCKTTRPCLHAASGLNYCVPRFVLSIQRNRGLEVIHRTPKNITQEIGLLPIKHSVVVGYSAGSINFRDRDGDQWGQIKMANGQLVGRITVDQDFEFQVICNRQ